MPTLTLRLKDFNNFELRISYRDPVLALHLAKFYKHWGRKVELLLHWKCLSNPLYLKVPTKKLNFEFHLIYQTDFISASNILMLNFCLYFPLFKKKNQLQNRIRFRVLLLLHLLNESRLFFIELHCWKKISTTFL